MLHFTNGSSVEIAASGVPGTVVFWNDVLHEGPVPAGLTLDQLRGVRERFLSQAYGIPSVSLAERDRALCQSGSQDEVVLWFEHDLYDQLQLLQILDWYAGSPHACRLSLIVIDRYLGHLKPEELAALFPSRSPASPEQLDLARRAWEAFRAPDPAALEALLASGTSALPFLHGALLRHLEQFPSVENGLARTERQILDAIAAGARSFSEIFLADQAREERFFMGDDSLRLWLDALAGCRHPLVSRDAGGACRLTASGSAVLGGEQDHVRLNGIDRWLGGVHLKGQRAEWRWDARAGSIAAGG